MEIKLETFKSSELERESELSLKIMRYESSSENRK